MNAAGSLGFAPPVRKPTNGGRVRDLGAFITNPISLRARAPTAAPVCIEYAGGFLLHTGLPNPGLLSVIEHYAGRWARADLPVIVHLMADRPEETRRLIGLLDGLENVLAAEL